MQNLIEKIKQFIHSYNPRAIIEIPPKPEFGHLSTNISVFLRGDAIDAFKSRFMEVFANEIDHETQIGTFTNIFLKPHVLKNQEMHYHTTDKHKFNMEFCSPNPTGPLHLGHLRNIVIGNSIYNLYKLCKFNAESENYINDQGNQMNQFLDTIRHYKNPNKYTEIYYKGAYVEAIANQVSDYVLKEDALQVIMKQINSTLHDIYVHFDNVTFESSLTEYVHIVINKLRALDLLEEGTMENQKTEGTLLMVKCGDERFVLQKGNGDFTYFAFDIAYFYSKSLRVIDTHHTSNLHNPLVIVLGEDHYSHIKKMTSVLAHLNVHIKVVKYAMVNVIKNGEIINMSKREGTLITINDILKDMDIQSLTTQIMRQNFDKVMNVYLDNDQSSINDILYIRHVYNKTRNILSSFEGEEEIHIETPIEHSLFSLLMHYTSVLKNTCETLNTHRIFEFSMRIIKLAHEYLSTDHQTNIILILKINQVVANLDAIFSFQLSHQEEIENGLFNDEINEIITNMKKQ
jgi:arginyl-tRNA synthetase